MVSEAHAQSVRKEQKTNLKCDFIELIWLLNNADYRDKNWHYKGEAH